MSLFERFSEKCDDGMEWIDDHLAAAVVMLFMVLAVVIAVVISLAVVYGDDRDCLRRGSPTYIYTNGIMMPIPGKCVEYAE